MRVEDPDRRNLLQGKVALITGGGGSLGTATARLFLKEGARVVLADLDRDSLASVESHLDDTHLCTVVSDATQEADVAAAVERTVDRFGGLDVVVAIAVHVRGVFLLCKHALQVMNDGGSIVIVSSVAGLRGDPGVSAYVAAKHAQVGLMRSIAKEAAPRGIRVNTIHPGPVDNHFQSGIEERLSPVLGRDATQFFDEQILLGRHARPEEIAQSVTYLASKQSSFTTGSTLVVDGGMSI
jgi:NAD(P)-dependent dehydrogenase (short-subunit alcohol dehydrogenase family)